MFCPSGRLKLGLTCQDSKIGQNYAQTWVNWVTVTGLTIAVTLRLYIDQADLRNTSLIRWLDCEWFSGIDKYWAERLSSKSGISNRQKNCWVPGGSVPASPSLKVLSEIFAPTKPIPTISPYPNFLGTFHDRDFFFHRSPRWPREEFSPDRRPPVSPFWGVCSPLCWSHLIKQTSSVCCPLVVWKNDLPHFFFPLWHFPTPATMPPTWPVLSHMTMVPRTIARRHFFRIGIFR